MPLNAQMKKLTVYAGNKAMADVIREGEGDIAGTLKVERFVVLAEKAKGREIAQFANVRFIGEY
jgi:hypothetical protein